MSTSNPTLQSNNKATDDDVDSHPSTPPAGISVVLDPSKVNCLLMDSLEDEENLTLAELQQQ